VIELEALVDGDIAVGVFKSHFGGCSELVLVAR